MNQRSSRKRSVHHLKHLVEAVVTEQFNLSQRGLAFLVDELEVSGRPPQRLRVWATLHFLPVGSPFCCGEPLDHVPLFAEYLDRVDDAIRRRMGILQEISTEFVAINVTSCSGVEFDDPFRATTPRGKDPDNIDEKDALGRTALMRAAIRGYDRQVEELLAAGADPGITDSRGRGILEQMPRGSSWIRTSLEEALTKHSDQKPHARHPLSRDGVS